MVDKAETLHGQVGADCIHSIHGLSGVKVCFVVFHFHENWLLTLVALAA